MTLTFSEVERVLKAVGPDPFDGAHAVLRLFSAASCPLAEDLAGQGEPVAWAYEWKIYTGWRRGVEFEKPCAGQFLDLRNIRPLGYLDEAAPAPSRPADREEIARLRMHLKDAADVFDVTGQRLAFMAIPGTQRSEIAKEMAFRAEQFRDALRDVPRDDGDGTQDSGQGGGL